MKLIISKHLGSVFAYFESERHHKAVEPQRADLERLDPDKLNHQCDLAAYDNCYFVIDVSKPKKGKKK